MFDKIKFLKAAALLKSFKGNLPKGDIDLNHVDDYHQYLTALQEQIGIDLDEFRIPKSAHKQRATPNSVSFDMFGHMSGEPYSYHPYCDGDAFRRQLDAVILFIDAYLPGLQSNQK